VSRHPAAIRALVALVAAAALALPPAGCGGGIGGGGAGGAGDGSSPAVVSLAQALASEEGRAVKVQGHLVATEGGVVLASALLESFPPQAGGAVLPVTGLDLTALVGLSSTAGQPDLAQVRWSDYPIMLQGVMKGGALGVEKVPRSVGAETAEAKVRFCLPDEPLTSGETAWWVFDVTNLTEASIDVTFASGRLGDVVLSQGGGEKYRWSEGKTFTQATRVDTLLARGTTPYVFNDILQVAPGEYELTATIAASAGHEGGGTALPELVTTVTVR
jgi:hypothetical protein